MPILQARYPDAHIVAIQDISPQQAPTISVASALYSYTVNAEQYLMGEDVITGGRGVWYVAVLGASAPQSEFHDVSNLAHMVLASPKVNKEWATAEIKGEETRLHIILNAQEAIANIINQHTPSGLDSKLSQAWSDTILVNSEWVSNTGITYNLPNEYQHYWADPSGNVAASITDTSPGPEFTPLAPSNVK